MLYREWKLIEGLEWADSLEEARVDDEYFERNLDAMRFSLEVNPRSYSHVFLTERENLRVWGASDYAAGYALTVYIEIDDASKSCELKWIDRRPIEPEPDAD